MTFPDTWETQGNRHPDDVLRISAPSNGEDPICNVKISDDKRYSIYPPEYGKAIQKEAVSIPFWKSYMGNYDEYILDRVYDGGGLGRWIASYALGSYSLRDGTAFQQRRAIMFASLYNNKLYIVECSTLNHGYERWDNDFRSIIKSIDFKKAYHNFSIGEYHDFLSDSDLYFWSQTGGEGTAKY
ncbi:MAG: DUF1887 family protein [Alphaproteobacteria bacterium]|nr:DUF1887 family protein [Alphaproteobacteria bacterium]